MVGYKQMNAEERSSLYDLLQSGHSITEIAKALQRHKSTIYRELRRNATASGAYLPDRAHSLAMKRCKRKALLDKDEALRNFVIDKLCSFHWTPEQISGYLKHRQKELPALSHETIYSWLYRPQQVREKLWKHLPKHKRKRGLRKYQKSRASLIPHRVSIHERPKEINDKTTFGHFEGDLMSFQKNSQHMLVIRERKTAFTLSAPLKSKRAEDTAQAGLLLWKKIPSKARQSLTLDNGGEFAQHIKWKEIFGIETYFCDPYCSWQKGGIENTNGRLRRDLPRSTNLKELSEDTFDEIIDNYNNTPRKCLGWLTPFEAFMRECDSVALQT